jgi:hypothetical protein
MRQPDLSLAPTQERNTPLRQPLGQQSARHCGKDLVGRVFDDHAHIKAAFFDLQSQGRIDTGAASSVSASMGSMSLPRLA